MVSGLVEPFEELGACKAALAAGVCQCCGGGAGAFRPQCVPMYALQVVTPTVRVGWGGDCFWVHSLELGLQGGCPRSCLRLSPPLHVPVPRSASIVGHSGWGDHRWSMSFQRQGTGPF